jgi:hypothetical protein
LFYGLSAAWALMRFGHSKNPTLTSSKIRKLFYEKPKRFESIGKELTFS